VSSSAVALADLPLADLPSVLPAIALIRPLYEGDESEFQEPLGIERLAGFLEANGEREVRLFDRRLYKEERKEERLSGQSDEDAVTFWADFKQAFPEDSPPDIIGLSVMTAEDVPDSLRLISRLKTHYPQAHFLIGGLFVTTMLELALKRFPADVQLVSCEGEIPLLEAARAAAAQRVAPAEKTTVRDLLGEPDSSMDTHLTPNEWAFASRPELERYLTLGCAMSLQSSRGCHGACSFCATPGLPAPYRQWQERSISLVVDEMALLALRVTESGLFPIFNFVDDDFGPLARIEALDLELRRRGLHIAYALQLRASALLGQDRLVERLTKLHQGGFTRVFLGVESLCSRTLEAWRKPYASDGLPEVFSALKRAGISAHIGYILWHRDSTVESLEVVLAECDRLSYRGLVHDEFPSDLHQIAEGLTLQITKIRHTALATRISSNGHPQINRAGIKQDNNQPANIPSGRWESCGS